MSTISGWCSQHGRPAHQHCHGLICTCWCHPDAAEIRVREAALPPDEENA